MDPTYRSQYLIDALRSMGQQPQQPQTPAALGGDLGARALQQFAQDRYYRQQAQNAGPLTGHSLGGGMTDPTYSAAAPWAAAAHGGLPQGYGGQPMPGGLPQAPAPPGAPPGPTAMGGLPGIAAQMMPSGGGYGGAQPPQGQPALAPASQQGTPGGFNWHDVLRSMAGAIGGQRYGG